jgi:hypothetical protein
MLGSSTTVKEISPSTELTPNSNILAIFLHLTDVVEKHYSDLCTFLSKTAVPIIAYSGGGASSEQKIAEKLEKKGIENHENWVFIQSKLDSPNDFGDSEWRGLVDWLLNPSPASDSDSLPAMISPARSVEYGLSLSLLCQGFLAQYALNPANCVNDAINTKGCADVRTALKSMGWVNEDGSKPEIVKELEHQRSTKSVDESQSERDEAKRDKSSSNSELGFWQSPFDGGKSLREGLEEECGALRKIVESKIQNGTLEWPDDALLPTRINRLVNAIKGGKVSDDQFVSVVARAYNDLSLLLEAV